MFDVTASQKQIQQTSTFNCIDHTLYIVKTYSSWLHIVSVIQSGWINEILSSMYIYHLVTMYVLLRFTASDYPLVFSTFL